MNNSDKTRATIDIQELKGRLAEAGRKIAMLRGYL